MRASIKKISDVEETNKKFWWVAMNGRRKKNKTTKKQKLVYSRQRGNKSWYLKTSIRSSRNQAHIGLAQFTHPHGFLSQQTPLAVWSDEESDAGYAALARIRYVYDSKTSAVRDVRLRFPAQLRSSPLGSSGSWPVSQCPLMSATGAWWRRLALRRQVNTCMRACVRATAAAVAALKIQNKDYSMKGGCFSWSVERKWEYNEMKYKRLKCTYSLQQPEVQRQRAVFFTEQGTRPCCRCRCKQEFRSERQH